MYHQAKNHPQMPTRALKKPVIRILSCCLLFLCGFSQTGKDSNETLPTVIKRHGKTYYKPSYFRGHFIDWQRGFQEGLGEVEVNGRWGLINSAGEIVIGPKFDEVCGFREGVGLVRTGAIGNNYLKAAPFGLAGHWKYINKEGEFIISDLEGGYFSEGIAPVCIPGKWEIVWAPSFGFTREEPKFGAMDKKGQMVVPAKYGWLDYFSEGLAVFCETALGEPNEKYGYLNPKGEVVIEPIYDGASAFVEGLALVNISGKAPFFINRAGEIVIAPQDGGPQPFQSFSEGLAAVGKDGKCGYIDKTGKLVIPCKFPPTVKPFSDGYAAVIVEGKIGYIDTNGEYAIKPRFEYFPYWETPRLKRTAPFFSSFSEGLAPVMTENLKWGYIDKKGEFVIEPKFDLAGQFTEGFAKVAVADKLGYIDKHGDYIWEPTR